MGSKKNTVKFDWLTVVFDFECEFDDRQSKLDYVLYKLHMKRLGKIVPMKTGLYTYSDAFTLSGTQIIVAYDMVSLDTLEIMIQLSGGGVDILQQALVIDNLSINNFIASVIDMGGHFSRVDVAADFINYDFHYSPHYLNEQAKSGHLLTKSRYCKYIHSYDSSGSEYFFKNRNPEEEGSTLYIGKTPKQFRIYNKYAERIAKVGLIYDVDSWYRWEFQLNSPYAQSFIDAFINDDNFNLPQTWLDYLAGNYRFLYTDLDGADYQKKRSRYDNASWWDDIVECADGELKLYRSRDKPNLTRTTNWIDRAVMPSVASIFLARLNKYRENGLGYDDAYELAMKQVQVEIANALDNNRVDGTRVRAFMNDLENLNNERLGY